MFTWVEHLVLLKLTRLPTEEERDQIASLQSLHGVVSVVQGENYTTRGQGYNYAIVIRLTSKEAEVAYQTTPLHVKVRDEVIIPLLVKDTCVCPATPWFSAAFVHLL